MIWCDGQGQWRAFSDVCPHRLVPLSDGRVTPEGQLECAYHGWRFESGGRCTTMPQGGDPSNSRACVAAYQCCVRQGIVWVKLQPASGASAPSADEVPTLPELDDEEWVGFGDMFRDLPYDYSTLMENVLDAGHVPFTHHGTVSKRQSSGLYDDMRVTEKGPWGFRGLWPSGPRRGGLGSQVTHFRAPVLMRHTIEALDTRGFSNITAVYGVPTTPGRCRALVRQPFRFKNRLLPKLLGLLPPFLGHLGNNDVLDDDVSFLHMQEEQLVKRGGGGEAPIGKVYYMPGASDAYVAGFRGWVQRFGGGGPFGPQDQRWLQAAGPRLPLPALLDHYHSHTEKCAVCRTALRRVKLLRVGAAAGSALCALAAAVHAGVSWGAARLASMQAQTVGQAVAVVATTGLDSSGYLLHRAGVLGAAALLLCLLAAWAHRTVQRFYTGSHPPPRNSVPGEWAP